MYSKDSANAIIQTQRRLLYLQDVGGSLQGDAIRAAKTQQGSGGGIPVAVAIPSARDAGRASQAGADGVILEAASMSSSSAADNVRIAY